jgi:endonuclease/exonuclease/phosphatase family metal-dependent hydrolase
MRKNLFGRALLTGITWALACAAGAAPLRPPSVPLVSVDPFFSVWSPADKLTEAPTEHWSGQVQPMKALLRVDGKAYRLMGLEPAELPALPQTSCTVLPLRTVCHFANAAVEAELTFATPLMPEDLEVFSRPVTYVALRVKTLDGKAHAVQFYYDVGGEIAVGDNAQRVVWQAEQVPGLAAARLGRDQQPVLGRSGDRIRVDWGWFWLAAPQAGSAVRAVSGAEARKAFAETGQLTETAPQAPAVVKESHPVLALVSDLGSVKEAETHLLLAYDDIDSVMFFNRPLKAWWRRNGLSFADMLGATERDYAGLSARMAAFDAELMKELRQVGGEKYAALAALAYRQSFAACKLVADPNGQPLYFSKENASNGCMGTVDVFYPQLPHLALMSPTLLRATLAPTLLYASDPRWRFDFAPHDIGQYPLGNGQAYGEGERGEKNQMPVEECGNLLICLGALSTVENSAAFAAQWWPTVTRWAEYLAKKGFDPENQLCTDDFAGHLAHNANLSIKAIMGLACYAKMAKMNGDEAAASRFLALAKEMVPKWMEAAKNGRGGSYRLAFDQADTWSMKYNLVWDRALGFNLFPPEVASTEVAYYRTAQQKYGLPLDSRKLWTKSDWLVWSATLTGKREDFEALVAPLYAFLDETPSRIPFGDWYNTDSSTFLHFRARSVVGGVYMPCLYDAALVKKYASRDTFATGLYAPLGAKPSAGTVLAPEGRTSAEIVWRYVTEEPAEGWAQPGFDDSGWQKGAGGFGAGKPPRSTVLTKWATPHLCVRRVIELPPTIPARVALSIYHDEDATVYLNGVAAARLTGYTTDYTTVEISEAARMALKPGSNVLAIEVSQTLGGQYLDAGLVSLDSAERFRIATFNIRCPIDKGDNAWTSRAPRVRELIRKHGFDLVGLQEATSNQIDDLLTEGWAYTGVGRDDGKRGGEASCIFYKKGRFEMRDTGTFWLSETPEVPGSKSWDAGCTRVCTWARMAERKSGREFFYFNTHLDHMSEAARANGMALILTRVMRLAQGRPVFLTGDMNATPGSAPIKRAAAVLGEASKLTRTPHAGPVPTSGGFNVEKIHTAEIDHIFVSGGVRVLTHTTFDDSQNTLYPSDHFPVAADVVLD